MRRVRPPSFSSVVYPMRLVSILAATSKAWGQLRCSRPHNEGMENCVTITRTIQRKVETRDGRPRLGSGGSGLRSLPVLVVEARAESQAMPECCCAAKWCSNSSKTTGISLFHFPTDDDRCVRRSFGMLALSLPFSSPFWIQF